MKTLILFFSGTGNTWWTSLQLKNELEKAGNHTEMFSIENPLTQDIAFVSKKIAEAENIVIAYPIYGSDMPANMLEFLTNLPPVDKKEVTVFCTQAFFSGDGNIFFRKELEKKGFRLARSFQIDFTTNLNVALFPFSLMRPANGAKLAKIRSKVLIKIKDMTAKIIEGKEYFEGTRFYQILLGRLQRFFFRRNFAKMTEKFWFSPKNCMRCLLCVKNCPSKNLEFSPDYSELKRGNNCILCMRCYNFCPACAINYGSKSANPKRFLRFRGPVENMKISDMQ